MDRRRRRRCFFTSFLESWRHAQPSDIIGSPLKSQQQYCANAFSLMSANEGGGDISSENYKPVIEK
jgi:hypothetical protein